MHVEQGLTRLLHALGSMLLTGSHVEIEGRAVKHCYILRMLVSMRLKFLHVDGHWDPSRTELDFDGAFTHLIVAFRDGTASGRV